MFQYSSPVFHNEYVRGLWDYFYCTTDYFIYKMHKYITWVTGVPTINLSIITRYHILYFPISGILNFPAPSWKLWLAHGALRAWYIWFYRNLTGNSRKRYDTFANYGDLFPVTQQQFVSRPYRGGREQTKSRRGFQSHRIEDKRRKEGAKTLDKVQDLVKQTLYPGMKGDDDLLAKIGEAHTLKAITLTITTGAIGFGLCHLNFIAVTYHEIAVPSV